MIEISLKKKRALVTGANSGIGAAIAVRLAEAGADVGVNFVSNPQAADDVAKTIRGKGGRALTLDADVSDARAVSAMFDRLDEEWGGIDILVNNAGIDGKSGKAWELEESDFEKVLEVNLLGVFYTCRQALRRMVAAQSGVVINISSVHEVIPWSGFSAYTAAKAGVSMLTKTLAQEAAPHGVRVLAVAPGAIKTPINRAVWGDPEGLKDLEAKIPMSRMGQRDEIANMVVVMASDLASYVTGTSVFVDGGMIDYASFSHGG